MTAKGSDMAIRWPPTQTELVAEDNYCVILAATLDAPEWSLFVLHFCVSGSRNYRQFKKFNSSPYGTHEDCISKCSHPIDSNDPGVFAAAFIAAKMTSFTLISDPRKFITSAKCSSSFFKSASQSAQSSCLISSRSSSNFMKRISHAQGGLQFDLFQKNCDAKCFFAF